MNAVALFQDPMLVELASFAEKNKSVGPRWEALHAALAGRVLPAQAKYRASLEAASKEARLMEARHDDARKLRRSLIEQLRALDHAIAEQYPAECAAADAEPGRIAAEANEAVSADDVALIASALDNYRAFSA